LVNGYARHSKGGSDGANLLFYFPINRMLLWSLCVHKSKKALGEHPVSCPINRMLLWSLCVHKSKKALGEHPVFRHPKPPKLI